LFTVQPSSLCEALRHAGREPLPPLRELAVAGGIQPDQVGVTRDDYQWWECSRGEVTPALPLWLASARGRIEASVAKRASRLS
jgi:hypothetical protein